MAAPASLQQNNPADGFRPYGITLAMASNGRAWCCTSKPRAAGGHHPPQWLLEDAKGLFASACEYGWSVDGAPGLVYTLDWHFRPVVRERLHWTHAEAGAAAQALLKRTGEWHYKNLIYRRFWEFCETHLIDRVQGSWHHELDPLNSARQQDLGRQAGSVPCLASGIAAGSAFIPKHGQCVGGGCLCHQVVTFGRPFVTCLGKIPV